MRFVIDGFTPENCRVEVDAANEEAGERQRGRGQEEVEEGGRQRRRRGGRRVGEQQRPRWSKKSSHTVLLNPVKTVATSGDCAVSRRSSSISRVLGATPEVTLRSFGGIIPHWP